MDYDDSAWQTVPHLHPIYDVRYDGHACFRTRFTLPESERGRPVTLVLGGLDDEDWQAYRLFVNGDLVDEWETAGVWREPRRVAIPAVVGENLVAVETCDLDRRAPRMPPGDDEHFFLQGWLLDQFVVTGEPYEVVDDFELVGMDDVVARLSARGFAATIVYESGEVARKRVSIRNERGQAVRLLDVVLDDLRGPFAEPTKGGRGWPVLVGETFVGVEHTAGVAQGEAGRIRVLLMPGATLEAGATYDCAPVVAGEEFGRYLLGLRPRRETRLTIYDTLGWTDYASELAERPRLTEELFEESLERLRELRREGVSFDLYALDDGWDPDDFLVFNRK